MAYQPPGNDFPPSTYGALGPPQGAANALANPRRYQPNATRSQNRAPAHPVAEALMNYAAAHAEKQAVNQRFKQALAVLKGHLEQAATPQIPNQAPTAASLLPNLANRSGVGLGSDRLPPGAAQLLPRVSRQRTVRTTPIRRAGGLLGPYQNF